MDKLLSLTYKLFFILLAIACTEINEEPTRNQLLDYWNREVDLTKDERKELALANIANSQDDYLKAVSHFIIGNFKIKTGEPASALINYAQARYHLIESGTIDDKILGHIYRNKGILSRKYGEYGQAVSYFDSAMSHYNHFPEDFTNERLSTMYISGLALRHIDAGQSLVTFNSLLEKSEAYQNISYKIKALRLIGEVHLIMSNYLKAKEYLNKALDLIEEVDFDDSKLKVNVLQSLGRVHYYTGDFILQEKCLRQALDMGIESRAFLLNVDLAESMYEQGKTQAAINLLTQIEKSFDQQPFDKENLLLYELLTEISPGQAKVAYKEKWEQEKERYEKETEAIVAQQQRDELRSIEQQAAYQLKQQQLLAANEKREMLWMMGLSSLGVLTLTFLVLFAYHRHKRRKLRKAVDESVAIVEQIYQEHFS